MKIRDPLWHAVEVPANYHTFRLSYDQRYLACLSESSFVVLSLQNERVFTSNTITLFGWILDRSNKSVLIVFGSGEEEEVVCEEFRVLFLPANTSNTKICSIVIPGDENFTFYTCNSNNDWYCYDVDLYYTQQPRFVCNYEILDKSSFCIAQASIYTINEGFIVKKSMSLEEELRIPLCHHLRFDKMQTLDGVHFLLFKENLVFQFCLDSLMDFILVAEETVQMITNTAKLVVSSNDGKILALVANLEEAFCDLYDRNLLDEMCRVNDLDVWLKQVHVGLKFQPKQTLEDFTFHCDEITLQIKLQVCDWIALNVLSSSLCVVEARLFLMRCIQICSSESEDDSAATIFAKTLSQLSSCVRTTTTTTVDQVVVSKSDWLKSKFPSTWDDKLLGDDEQAIALQVLTHPIGLVCAYLNYRNKSKGKDDALELVCNTIKSRASMWMRLNYLEYASEILQICAINVNRFFLVARRETFRRSLRRGLEFHFVNCIKLKLEPDEELDAQIVGFLERMETALPVRSAQIALRRAWSRCHDQNVVLQLESKVVTNSQMW